jgi:urease subunit alpha
MVIVNALVIDAVAGIVKGDIGIKDGRIVGIGKAGNPHIMAGVDPRLIVGPNTQILQAEGMIATVGGLDVHTHFVGADQSAHALSSGITTMIGGALGPTFNVDCGGSWTTEHMLRAAEAFSVNFGFFAQGSSHKAESIVEHLAAGIIGVKIHEDFGAMPATIDTCLKVADDYDFQVQLHADTINEAGFYESTMRAIGGRTIHMYHTEGAGGGHAPDIIRCNGEPNCLTSSTTPTNPYTANALDEHLDMTMMAHLLSPRIPEDVAFAESRIRPQTMAAEDVLHDLGAIAMMGSDSQGMGRIAGVVGATWQLASKMKDQRGRLPGERTRAADNERVKRYIAKYTINAARTFGIDRHIGSVEQGKMADLVLWRPAFFGIKPEIVVKGGFVVWAQMGDGAACLGNVEPVMLRPQWGAFGRAPQRLSATFVHPLALEQDLAGRLGLAKPLLPMSGTRRLGKKDMLHNDACPRITVNAQTFEVFVDGELASCAPAREVALGQKYLMR